MFKKMKTEILIYLINTSLWNAPNNLGITNFLIDENGECLIMMRKILRVVPGWSSGKTKTLYKGKLEWN